MEDFSTILAEFKPVVFKSARKTGELLGSSVVVATIQSLMVDRRYREEFTPSTSTWSSTTRRAAELGMRIKIGCHTFRATGITAYLEAGGTLENAQAMAAHESPRTTKPNFTTTPAMK